MSNPTADQRQALAKGLAKNRLLPEILDDFKKDLREQWEATQPDEAETRERVYVELRTLDNLRDSIYARINELVGDGGK